MPSLERERQPTAEIGGNKRTVQFTLKVSRRTDCFPGFLGGIAVTLSGSLAGVVGIWNTHDGGRLGAGFADDLM